jgi:hypothetical protein
MFVKPSSAFVGWPSVVASSSAGRRTPGRRGLLPSTRKSSDSRAGASSSWSSSPVSVFGISFECTVAAVPSATTFALFSAAALALIVVPGRP